MATAALLLAHATKETSVVLVPISLGWLALERWSSRERGAWVRFAGHLCRDQPGRRAGIRRPAMVLRAARARRRNIHAGVLARRPDRGRRAVPDLRLAPPGLRLPPAAAWRPPSFPWPAAGRHRVDSVATRASGWGAGSPSTCRGRRRSGTTCYPSRSGRRCWAARSSETSGVSAAITHQRGDAPRHGRSSSRAALLWSVTIVNAVADARVQLAVDRANADLVDVLADLPSPSRVVVNTTRVNEYVFEMPLHLSEIKRRPDVFVEHIAQSGARRGRARRRVRGDARNGQPAGADRPDRPRRAGRQARQRDAERGPGWTRRAGISGGQRRRLLELGVHRLLCRVSAHARLDATYCPTDRGVIYWRTFSYGWQLHRLGPPAR